jgi:GT2 family glycosyltransferase
MDVSIIIVNYNTKDLLVDCINSIYQQTKDVVFEIIVVDNSSTDGSEKIIKEKFPKTVFLQSGGNIGFGKANNLGVEKAIGEYVFLLNSDTILLNNAVLCFFNFSKSNKNLNVGCLGTVLLDEDRNSIHSSGSFPSKRRIIFEVLNNYLNNFFRSPFKKERREFGKSNYFEVDYITGADLFLSRKLFRDLKGFDPMFFMYYEETDLQKQISKLGMKRLLIKGAEIIHLEGGSNKAQSFSAKRRIMISVSLFKYLKKNSFILNYYIFRLIFFIIRLPIFFDSRITYKERKEYIYSLLE